MRPRIRRRAAPATQDLRTPGTRRGGRRRPAAALGSKVNSDPAPPCAGPALAGPARAWSLVGTWFTNTSRDATERRHGLRALVGVRTAHRARRRRSPVAALAACAGAFTTSLAVAAFVARRAAARADLPDPGRASRSSPRARRSARAGCPWSGVAGRCSVVAAGRAGGPSTTPDGRCAAVRAGRGVRGGGAVGTLVRNRAVERGGARPGGGRGGAAADGAGPARRRRARAGRDRDAGRGRAARAGPDPAGARAALEAIRDSARESLDALRAELAQVSPAQPATGAAPAAPGPGRPRRPGRPGPGGRSRRRP